MGFQLLGEHLNPAEGETAVRAYHTTTLSSGLLGLKAEGYLTVTNLRVVFYGLGSAFAGKSILQSEVPIADVSGITSYKGAHFSLTHLFTAAGVSVVIAAVVATISSTLIGGIAAGIVLALQNSDLTAVVPMLPLALGVAFIAWSLQVERHKILRSILAACGSLTFASVGGFGLTAASFGSIAALRNLAGLVGGVGLLLGMAASIYALVCFFWYARRETMALAISSKGGSSTPIAISGIAGFGLFSGAAVRALSAEPAEDVERMIKELGAMITDIQAMGVHGVEKWHVA